MYNKFYIIFFLSVAPYEIVCMLLHTLNYTKYIFLKPEEYKENAV